MSDQVLLCFIISLPLWASKVTILIAQAFLSSPPDTGGTSQSFLLPHESVANPAGGQSDAEPPPQGEDFSNSF